MDNKLYEDLKHCWKMGYKLPKIKEYCDTDYSIDELQALFMEMWEAELDKIYWKQFMNGTYFNRHTLSNQSWEQLVGSLESPPNASESLKQLMKGECMDETLSSNTEHPTHDSGSFHVQDLMLGMKYQKNKCLACGKEHGCGSMPCSKFKVEGK